LGVNPKSENFAQPAFVFLEVRWFCDYIEGR